MSEFALQVEEAVAWETGKCVNKTSVSLTPAPSPPGPVQRLDVHIPFWRGNTAEQL